MSDCVEITNASLLHLAKHPNITIIHTLRIDRCCELTDTSLIPLGPLATDAVLGDLGMSDNDCVTDDALTALALSCPSYCREVTEAGLLRFAQIKNTMSLNVGLCSKITNASAKSLARLCIARPSSTGMHTLNSLHPPAHLHQCGRLSATRQCLDLKLLDVSRCDALTDEAFEGWRRCVCPR
ncbi:hypothetical protein BC829DRAFT_387393 [Chytridium lagenaria]|nr:hypothetical protein BC829DRAFT_387393 [Chytridium lagenaria]